MFVMMLMVMMMVMMFMTMLMQMFMGMRMLMIVGMLMLVFMGMGMSVMSMLVGMRVAVSADMVVMNVHSFLSPFNRFDGIIVTGTVNQYGFFLFTRQICSNRGFILCATGSNGQNHYQRHRRRKFFRIQPKFLFLFSVRYVIL